MQPQQTGIYPQQAGFSMQYQQPLPTGQAMQPAYTGYTAVPAAPQVEFSWDMTSEDMTAYQNIFAKYANDTGKVKCKPFPLYLC